MSYDACEVVTVSADTNAALTGCIAIHKVQITHADGSAVFSVALHDALTVTGTAKIVATTEQVYAANFTRSKSEDFPRPVRFDKGLSIDITGTGNVRVYYTRG
jgi:hypothetical protein